MAADDSAPQPDPGERPRGRVRSWIGPGLLLLLLAVVAVCSLSLGSRDLWAPDEPRYALVAREMIETGDFLIPHLNGEAYSDKPPLFFWLIALASVFTGGVGQSAAVLPSILAGIATLLAVARLTSLLGDAPSRRAPLLAAGLLAVSYRFVSQATVGQIDLLLAALETWAFVFLVDALWRERSRPIPRLTLAFLLVGLGILAKGPVALICPVGGFVLGALLAHRRQRLGLLLHPLPWLAMLTVVAAWLVPAALAVLSSGQEDYLTDLLFRQTVVRYVAAWHHQQPFWYLWVVPWYDALPVSLLAPAALWRLLRGPERPRPALLLAGACLLTLAFFSLSSGKRAVYLVPMYPLIAAWLALDIDARLTRRGSLGSSARVGAAIAGFLPAAALVGLLLAWPPAIAGEIEAAIGSRLSFPVGLSLALAAAAAGSVVLALSGRRSRLGLASAAAGWGLFYAAALATINPTLDPLKSAKPFVDELRAVTVADSRGAMIDLRAQFVFHAGPLEAVEPNDVEGLDSLAARLSSDEPSWVIVRTRWADALKERLGPRSAVETLVRRRVGGKTYLLLANRAARASEARE